MSPSPVLSSAIVLCLCQVVYALFSTGPSLMDMGAAALLIALFGGGFSQEARKAKRLLEGVVCGRAPVSVGDASIASPGPTRHVHSSQQG